MANMVKSGAYAGKFIYVRYNIACIDIGKRQYMDLAKWSVADYEIISGNTRKSMSSSIIRGAIGGALFGTPGMMAGGLSAKNKTIYTIAVRFKDGKRSVIEIDDKAYTAFMGRMI